MKIATLRNPGGRLNGSVHIPGSKSYTNRALILAALGSGTSTLQHASLSADSDALISALRALGITITLEATGGFEKDITVLGRAGERDPCVLPLDVGPAGTTMRFLTAFCAATSSTGNEESVELRGSERMHMRPIFPLVSSLQSMGCDITYLGHEGCPPIRIRRTQALQGGKVMIDGSVSSQFISALLMVAPLCATSLHLQVTGPALSQSYIEMTLQSMRDFGVTVTVDATNPIGRSFVVPTGQHYSGRVYSVEGDASGASYLWALAALSGGSITTTNINPHSAQGDVQFPLLLERMGCAVSFGENSVTVRGADTLLAIDADMSNMPDAAQTLAVIAACASGTSTIRGLSTLRVKETDRIAAVATELAKMGIVCEAGPDFLIVHGGTPQVATISTYEDHRMAMAFATLAARVDGLQIEDPAVVDKSFPTFWTVLEGLRMGIEYQ